MSSTRSPRSALLLVGHGSHLSPDSSAPVYAHAERIRRLGVFDEVLEGFWKEEPSLRDALDLIDCENVWIVPLFLAEGYFTRQVLPRELGLDGALTLRGQQTVRYCPPVGTHPLMDEMILQRARSASGLSKEERRGAALVVIGHGTERSASSGDTVYALVDRLRESGEFGAVDCGFLDEEPTIDSVLDRIAAPSVVLVPFFVAEGWHTRTTIPEDLGLTGDLTTRGGRNIWYAPPIGTLPEVADVALAIATEAGAPDGRDRPEDGSRAAEPGTNPLRTARLKFFHWLDSGGTTGRTFLQIQITRNAEGRYQLRNAYDADRQEADLECHSDPDVGRSIARFADDGQYRPLRSASNLRTGWALVDLDADRLWSALSSLYPGAVLHWHRAQIGDLQTASYVDWAARQSGIYARLRDLPESELPMAVQACCESKKCLRARVWEYSSVPKGAAIGDAVPCPEPCTLFATVAREMVTRATMPSPEVV